MSNLQFLDLQNDVSAHTGLDITDATNLANVKRWLNYVQQDLCSRWPWSFLFGRETVVTIPDYLTGTASITSGGTTVTGSGTTFSASIADGTYYIQFSTANDWYNLSAYSSGTSLTTAVAYQQTTNAVNVTYVIRKFFYALSANADQVLDIRNWNTPVKMIQCDFRTIDLINPLVQSTNAPYGYMMFGTNSSGNLLIQPYPFPQDARLFEVRTRLRPTDMSGNTDSPSIPNKYAHLLIFGANAIGFAYLRKFDEAEAWSSKFEQRVNGMMKEYKQSGDYQPVLSSIDSISRSRWIQFPSEYPIVGGS